MDTSHSTPRAVELIRVSTQGQADRDTPEIQRRALDRLRTSRPCVVVERVEALGISGALGLADRVDLRRLQELSRSRSYDELRVWNVDRLTRAEDPRERFAIYGFALDAGALIVDATGKVIDPSDESGIGELDWYLQTFFAAKERRKIIDRTSAGRRKAAEDGHLSQGSPPYGRRYDHEARQWVVVPRQLEVYRRIVSEIIAGRSTRDVAEGLNRDGIASTRTGHWAHSTVKKLLQVESIVGRYRTCGVTTEIPPVVDEVTWARVRAALRSHLSSSGPRPRLEAALRGLLRCKACGRSVHVLSDGVGRSHRYACPLTGRRSPGDPCRDRRTVRVEDADAALRSRFVEVLSDARVLRAAVEAGQSKEATSPVVDRAAEAQSTIDRLRVQETRLLRLLDDELVSESVARDRLAQLRASQHEAGGLLLRALTAAADTAQPTDAELSVAVASLGKAVRWAKPSHFRDLLRILVPAREPFGLWLSRDGLEAVGRLPLDAAALAGDLVTGSASSGQMPGALFRVAVTL